MPLKSTSTSRPSVTTVATAGPRPSLYARKCCSRTSWASAWKDRKPSRTANSHIGTPGGGHTPSPAVCRRRSALAGRRLGKPGMILPAAHSLSLSNFNLPANTAALPAKDDFKEVLPCRGDPSALPPAGCGEPISAEAFGNGELPTSRPLREAATAATLFWVALLLAWYKLPMTPKATLLVSRVRNSGQTIAWHALRASSDILNPPIPREPKKPGSRKSNWPSNMEVLQSAPRGFKNGCRPPNISMYMHKPVAHTSTCTS
mmetsp:Transcript_23566/g.67488  ORF Transcript_23566/g.67488 Transcript_23566/m.67488 type:complete len:260 (-) Transcript_23566:617-1396(-)